MKFPLKLKGDVTHGFKRGSKQLGIPTANLPESVASEAGNLLDSGIYYGYAKVDGIDDDNVRGMVMSFGWNPVFENPKRTAEVYIMHEYGRDFYGETLSAVVCGFIRPELKFSSLDELIKAIHSDIEFAKSHLQLNDDGIAVDLLESVSFLFSKDSKD